MSNKNLVNATLLAIMVIAALLNLGLYWLPPEDSYHLAGFVPAVYSGILAACVGVLLRIRSRC
ncbi:hypothetical protein ABIC83_002765 [Roseateles asaccharophilus]|uniref:hypothetical protein n=1 Tax=Roseateles asaccharophilus TaxID=582607 RepID=UPI0038362D11